MNSCYLEVIRRHAELKFIKQQEEATTLPEQALPTRQAVFHKLCQYQADPCWSRVAPQVQELRHCTWGPTLTAKLQDWCDQIRWPTNRTDDEIQNAGLTWIDMVLSFMIFARCFLPVKRPGQEGVMMLTPIQSFAALKAYDVKLSELANLFAIFCKQLQDLQDTPIFPEVERGLVRSLYIQGAAFSAVDSGYGQLCRFKLRFFRACNHTYFATEAGHLWIFLNSPLNRTRPCFCRLRANSGNPGTAELP